MTSLPGSSEFIFWELSSPMNLENYTLILPSISVGNVGQLAVDLLLNNLNVKKAACINHPSIIPMAKIPSYITFLTSFIKDQKVKRTILLASSFSEFFTFDDLKGKPCRTIFFSPPSSEKEAIPLVALILICSEGNNYPEAFRTLECLNKWLLLKEDMAADKWQTPFSWKLPYGSAAPKTLY
ncbi:UNVERIFIED_CONTAM: psmg2 [Trichonephila clavipes]